jgi:hypothetical protein
MDSNQESSRHKTPGLLNRFATSVAHLINPASRYGLKERAAARYDNAQVFTQAARTTGRFDDYGNERGGLRSNEAMISNESMVKLKKLLTESLNSVLTDYQDEGPAIYDEPPMKGYLEVAKMLATKVKDDAVQGEYLRITNQMAVENFIKSTYGLGWSVLFLEDWALLNRLSQDLKTDYNARGERDLIAKPHTGHNLPPHLTRQRIRVMDREFDWIQIEHSHSLRTGQGEGIIRRVYSRTLGPILNREQFQVAGRSTPFGDILQHPTLGNVLVFGNLLVPLTAAGMSITQAWGLTPVAIGIAGGLTLPGFAVAGLVTEGVVLTAEAAATTLGAGLRQEERFSKGAIETIQGSSANMKAFVKRLHGIDVDNYEVVNGRPQLLPGLSSTTSYDAKQSQKNEEDWRSLREKIYLELGVDANKLDPAPESFLGTYIDGNPEEVGTLWADAVLDEFQINTGGILDAVGRNKMDPMFDMNNLDYTGNYKRYMEARTRVMTKYMEKAFAGRIKADKAAAKTKEGDEFKTAVGSVTAIEAKINDRAMGGRVMKERLDAFDKVISAIDAANTQEGMAHVRQDVIGEYSNKVDALDKYRTSKALELGLLPPVDLYAIRIRLETLNNLLRGNGAGTITERQRVVRDQAIADTATEERNTNSAWRRWETAWFKSHIPPTRPSDAAPKQQQDAYFIQNKAYLDQKTREGQAEWNRLQANLGARKERIVAWRTQELQKIEDDRTLFTAEETKIKEIRGEILRQQSEVAAETAQGKQLSAEVGLMVASYDRFANQAPYGHGGAFPITHADLIGGRTFAEILTTIHNSNAPPTLAGWPPEQDNTANVMHLVRAMAEARARHKFPMIERVINFAAPPGPPPLDEACTFGKLTEEQVRCMTPDEIIDRINILGLGGVWAHDPATVGYLQGGIDEARKRYAIRQESYEELTTALAREKVITQADRIHEQQIVEQEKGQFEMVKTMMGKQADVFEAVDEMMKPPVPPAILRPAFDTTIINPGHPDAARYTPIETAAGAPLGYLNILNILTAYQTSPDRRGNFERISSIITMDELSIRLNTSFGIVGGPNINATLTAIENRINGVLAPRIGENELRKAMRELITHYRDVYLLRP